MEWGKGLVQKQEREEKLENDVYEADKPLARYKNDQDLDKLLKQQEREGMGSSKTKIYQIKSIYRILF